MKTESVNMELFITHQEQCGPQHGNIPTGKHSTPDMRHIGEDTLLETPQDQAHEPEGQKNSLSEASAGIRKNYN